MSQRLQQRRAARRLPGGEGYPVDGGYQADGVSDGGGVHIVLDEFRGHHQTAGGQVCGAAGHACVEDHVHPEAQAEDLGRHGGVDFADAAYAGGNAGGNFKRGTPEMVFIGARSSAPGRARSSSGMANCRAIFINVPPKWQ